MKGLRIGMFLLSLLGLIACGGCAKTNLYVIDKQDIAVMDKGVAYTPDRDGFFLSTFYVQEVMEAKVIDTKLN